MNNKTMMLGVLLAGLFAPKMMFADPASACDALGSANLVQNCGFETGDFTGWQPGGDIQAQHYTVVADNGYGTAANSGNYFAALGSTGSDDILYQDIATDIGQTYSFSFYLASDGDTPNDFTAKWGGNVVFSESDSPLQYYALYGFTEVATSTTTRIEFDSRDDPGHLGLDDVEVVAAEPSLAFFGSILLGLPLLGFRRRRQTLG